MNYARLLRVALAVLAIASVVFFVFKPSVLPVVVAIGLGGLVFWNRPWIGKPEDRTEAVNDIAARYLTVLRLLANTGGKLTHRQINANSTELQFAAAVEAFILRLRGKKEERPLTKYERLTLLTRLSGNRKAEVKDEIRRAADAFYCSLNSNDRNQVLTLVRAGK